MYKRILVPLDGSELGEAILPHSVELARHFDATLVLLRVSVSAVEAIQQLTPGEPPGVVPLSVSLADQIVEAGETAAQEYLQGLSRGLNDSGVRHESLVVEGDPLLAIRQSVAAQRIDLVTMSTHGRSALGRLIQGSVAEGLVHEISVPVMLLHVRS